MSFLGWMALGGGVLLLIALSSAYLRDLPVSTSVIYLALGAAIGPLGGGWLRIDLRADLPWFERLTEVAVIVALYVGGLKLRLPLRDPAWVAAYRLAGPVMLASILGVALCAHLLLGLDPGTAILAGAVLAPTDPVLANTVKVSSAADRDRMRYGLSGEAGRNDLFRRHAGAHAGGTPGRAGGRPPLLALEHSSTAARAATAVRHPSRGDPPHRGLADHPPAGIPRSRWTRTGSRQPS